MWYYFVGADSSFPLTDMRDTSGRVESHPLTDMRDTSGRVESFSGEAIVMRCSVLFHWDSEAKVWTATSDDVPGLVLESPSFDRLVKRVRAAIPELLELNGYPQNECRISIQTDREDLIPAYG